MSDDQDDNPLVQPDPGIIGLLGEAMGTALAAFTNTKALAEMLIDKGVFTRAEWEAKLEVVTQQERQAHDEGFREYQEENEL